METIKKWLKRFVKDERGLTLIELLAVIVILGIIAAIAVPAITGITGNTKKEAHKANARQMIEAAKQKVAISGFKPNTGTTAITATRVNDDGERLLQQGDTLAADSYMVITLDQLKDDGYFSKIVDPESSSGNEYDDTNTAVYVTKNGSTYRYYIKLDSAGADSDLEYVKEEDIDKVDFSKASKAKPSTP